MKTRKNKELWLIFGAAAVYFALFLAVPAAALLGKSFVSGGGAGLANYADILGDADIRRALGNSFLVSGVSAAVTTMLAFLLSYTVHYTHVPGWLKKAVAQTARLPMLLPTITYGFAIMYSFGKQGLLTKLFGRQLFDIYGFNGLLTGYVIYTLPVSFMLIQNTMQYIDKSFTVVSRLLQDNPVKNFGMTVLRPLSGALYREMLGSVPDFGRGAVIALLMLLPSVLSVAVLHLLEKYNVRYTKISRTELSVNRVRDVVCGTLSGAAAVCVLAVFAVIFVIPFVQDWPYHITFTLSHFSDVMQDSALRRVMGNSLTVSLLTALLGTLTAYGCALVSARSSLPEAAKKCVEAMAMITNTIPGMVLGLAYLFVFSGSFLQGTLAILVLCNVIHYFSTPYLMMKASLSKLNASWETTAMLMGDSWIKTVARVVTPNVLPTILEVFGYYFVNAMVTISAVIFIAGARTMVITTKIKELQYYNKYSEIFVLSLFILFVNFAGRELTAGLANRKKKEKKER